ncbi:MAG: hypothetical protein Kow00133_20920 [Amphiplicatus sp.]
MILLIIALIVLAPLVELYILIQAGAAFGALPVIAACIATAALGGLILRAQGLSALARARRDLDEGRAPVEAAVDGAFLVVAAPLLMTPGFVTDALGFALLVPPLCHAIARAALRRIRRGVERGETRIYIARR